GIVAYAGAPLLHDGHLQASLSVVADQPRRWQQHQAALLQTVVERLWSAVEKLRAEAELRASEAELRLITNTVPGLIAYVDAHQQYQFVNSAYEQWFARPTAAIIGHPMQELLGETVYQRKQPHILAALAGEFVTFEDDIL
ncbi:MAG TPA: PAS domain-containing protein, partial [Caldilineaceae bacterium]|nr:PAS domain-containing protein [Caldilineaceae bacterium]